MARFAYFVQTFSFYLIGKHGPKKILQEASRVFGKRKLRQLENDFQNVE